jgi:hypothetical protein
MKLDEMIQSAYPKGVPHCEDPHCHYPYITRTKNNKNLNKA